MNEYRITGLELNGIGVFDQLTLSFPGKPEGLNGKAEIHIFTGINGTGKTTLLQALTSFDRASNAFIAVALSGNSNTNNDENFMHPIHAKWNLGEDEINNQQEVRIKFPGDQFSIEPFKNSNLPDILQSYQRIIDNANLSSQKYSSLKYAFFAYSGNRQVSKSTETMAMREIGVNPLVDALDWNRKEIGSELFQWILNCRTKSAVAYQNGDFKLSAYYVELLDQVEKSVAAIIGRREVKFIIDQHSLFVKVQLDDMPIAFEQLAEGYKSIISWLADLMYRLDTIGFKTNSPFTLFLDEIDVHLHPAAQRRILPVIQKLFPNAQIFLTTHSPFVLGSVDGAWIYKFKFDEKGNSVLDGGKPVLSEDGLSYNYIMDDVLGIKERFGVDVEKHLAEFYEERDKLIKKPSSDPKILLKLSKDIALQSIELQSIIGSELRQLSRITKKELSI